MKPSDSNDEHNDPVWKLLESSRRTEASPVFVQNVVRKARQMKAGDESGESLLGRCLGLFRQPAFALTAAAVVVVAVIGVRSLLNDSPEAPIVSTDPAPVTEVPEMAIVEEYSFADEVEDIDYLGELVAVTDPAALDDQMMADLLY